MITIQCDKCDKPYEVDDDATAGEKVQCPYCGDVGRVPAASRANVPQAGGGQSDTPAVLKGTPARAGTAAAPASKAVDSEPERTIAVVRQGMFRAQPFRYLLMVLIGIGGLIVVVLSKTTAKMPKPDVMVWVGVALLVVGVVWWLVWWAAPHRWVKLTITNKRTIRQEGIVLRKTSEVMHRHVTNVTIKQTLLQRLLSVGYIGIDSAGQGGEIDSGEKSSKRQSEIEIEVFDVPHPYRIKEIIDRYR